MERTLTFIPESSEQFRASIRDDANAGIKRDKERLIKDCLVDVLLNEAKGYRFFFDIPGQIPDLPTIVAINHFSRPIWSRRTTSTTSDILLITEAVTLYTQQLTTRPVNWISQADIKDHFLGIIPLHDRQTQLAAAICYDFISVKKKKRSFSTNKHKQTEKISADTNPLKDSVNWLKQGGNLFLVPEGKPKSILRPNLLAEFDRSFPLLLRQLSLEKVTYQLLPVTVFARGKNFYLKFGHAQEPTGSPTQIAQQLMVEIAKSLPATLRGPYKKSTYEQTTSTKIPPLPQPEDGQKLSPAVPQSTSAGSASIQK